MVGSHLAQVLFIRHFKDLENTGWILSTKETEPQKVLYYYKTRAEDTYRRGK